MPGEVSQQLHIAEWEMSGPCPINSVEKLPQGDLGPAYTDGVDTRWPDTAILGPLLTTVSASSVGGTTEEAHSAAYLALDSTHHFLYFNRGTDPGKLKIDDWTMIDPAITLAGEGTSVIATRSADGSQEVSFGMEDDQNTAYTVVTSVSQTTPDTSSANDESKKTRFFGQAPKERVIGLGGNANVTLAKGNVMTGSVTMDGSSWSSIGSVTGPATLKFTGFAMDGPDMILGTNYGPYVFNEDDGAFFPVLQAGQTSPDDDNCRGMVESPFLGVHIPMKQGGRWFRNGASRSWGVNIHSGNQSPAWGQYTGYTQAAAEWSYMAVRNANADDVYIVAYRPWEAGDPEHADRMTPFVIGKLTTGVECRFLWSVGHADGVLTNAAVVGGHDSDVFYFIESLRSVPWDDSGYTYNTTDANWYGTEMRRDPQEDKYPEVFEFETKDCAAARTLQMYVSVEGGTRVALGSPIVSDGLKRVTVPKELHGARLTPSIKFTTDTSATSPRVIGKLRMYYRTAPRLVDGKTI